MQFPGKKSYFQNISEELFIWPRTYPMFVISQHYSDYNWLQPKLQRKSKLTRFKVSAPALGYPWQQMWNKANIVRFLPVNFCSNTCFFQPKSQVVTMRQNWQMEGHRNLNFEFQNLNQMIMPADRTQRQMMHSIWPRAHFCTVNSLTVFFLYKTNANVHKIFPTQIIASIGRSKLNFFSFRNLHAIWKTDSLWTVKVTI